MHVIIFGYALRKRKNNINDGKFSKNTLKGLINYFLLTDMLLYISIECSILAYTFALFLFTLYRPTGEAVIRQN